MKYYGYRDKLKKINDEYERMYNVKLGVEILINKIIDVFLMKYRDEINEIVLDVIAEKKKKKIERIRREFVYGK